MAHLLDLRAEGPGDTSRPPPDRVIAGDPVHTTWSVEERAGLYAGLWQSTPGRWRVVYDEWEYFRILSGRSVLTSDAGSVPLGPGASLIVQPGFEGIWTVEETTLKEYVILAPAPPPL